MTPRPGCSLKGLHLLLALSASFILVSPVAPSSATSSFVLTPGDPSSGSACAGIGGIWNGTSACSLAKDLTLDTGDSVILNPGAVLVIEDGATFTNSGTVLDNGTIVNDPSGTIANLGNVTGYVANGALWNAGTLTNFRGGSIGVERAPQTSAQVGSFNFTNSGEFANQGTFLSFGNFTSDHGASITNSGNFTLDSGTIDVGGSSAPLATNAGTFSNDPSGTLTDRGATFNNTGALVNAGALVEQQGVFSPVYNFGRVNSNGTITDSAYFGNYGTVSNSGTIETYVGCNVADCGSFVNNNSFINDQRGSFENGGNFGNTENASFTNYGNFTNERLLMNDPNGTIANFGSLTSTATVQNEGLIGNFASFASSGIVLNSGTIANSANATFVNSHLITNTGTVANSGTLTDACGGVVEGTGIVLEGV